MTSCLFMGQLSHARRRPVAHDFRYPVVSFYLDLDELAALSKLRLFGVNARRPFSFRDADHMDGRAGSTREKVLAFARTQGVTLERGKVRVLTQCRMLGYVFNPVSFYFLHESSGPLRAIVAEVNNTFGERYLYWLDERSEHPDASRPKIRRYAASKRMHVSPFVSMDADYEFRFAPVGARLSVAIAESEHGEAFFDAHLSGRRSPLDDRSLAGVLVRYPLQTLRITAAIHWQALRLYRKGVPVHHQPAPTAEQQTQARLLETIAQGIGS